MLESFAIGFSEIASVECILLCAVGVALGILFGASPGLTSAMGVALLLPVTYSLSIINGLSLLLGIYIGGISGGLITAVLINIPGTPASIATTFDGYPMTQKGQAGKALRTGMTYSFLGGMFSLIILMFLSPALARIALKFSPVEYFSIALFSLTLIASLSGKSIVKGMLAALIGIAVTTVGSAPIDGVMRYTFGNRQMNGGIQMMPVIVGIYAVMEVLKIAENRKRAAESGEVIKYEAKGLGVNWREFKEQFGNFFRSAAIGTGIGILPGLGAGISNLIAYTASKKASKHPELYGTGIIDGVIASETANNAVSGGALVPLLAMGIPGDQGTAVLLAAFMMKGITAGPLMFTNNGNVIYGIFCILIVANILMLAMEYFCMPAFLKMIKVPKHILLSIILVLCVVGSFATNNRVFDVWCILFFGILGYVMYKLSFPLPPVVLGYVLGSLLETNLRRGIMMSYGSLLPFITRPVSALFILLTVGSIIYKLLQHKKKRTPSQVS